MLLFTHQTALKLLSVAHSIITPPYIILYIYSNIIQLYNNDKLK